jgi:hypothetical protein
MQASNLSIIFGPLLFKEKKLSTPSEMDGSSIQKLFPIVTCLIEHYTTIFGDIEKQAEVEKERFRQETAENKKNRRKAPFMASTMSDESANADLTSAMFTSNSNTTDTDGKLILHFVLK